MRHVSYSWWTNIHTWSIMSSLASPPHGLQSLSRQQSGEIVGLALLVFCLTEPLSSVACCSVLCKQVCDLSSFFFLMEGNVCSLLFYHGQKLRSYLCTYLWNSEALFWVSVLKLTARWQCYTAETAFLG